jgi:PKD repeat protein
MMKQTYFVIVLCVLLIAVPLLCFAADPTEPLEFSPVQKGYVSSGERILPYAPDRIMVQFTAGSMENSKLNIKLQRGSAAPGAQTGIPSVDALCSQVGVTKISRPYIELKNETEMTRLGIDRWYMLELAGGGDIFDIVKRFESDPNVEYAKPDWRAFPAVIPSDPLYPDHWGHNNTAQLPDLDWGGTYDHTLPNTVGTPGFDANAPGAWDASQGFGDASVIIGIIDSGVDLDHPDLTLVAGYDFGDNDSNPDDNSAAPGHGTCCAGVAAAKVNNGLGACGIAPGARVMPLKVANSAGSMYFSSIQNALYYAADNGCDIASMSLSADISSDPATDAAITYAYNAGVVILAATSNSNQSHIHYPANHAYVIGVGAASPCGDRKRSSSNSAECNPGVSTDPNGYTCDGERWWGSNYGTTSQDAAGAVDILGPTILPTSDIAGSGGYRSGDYEPFFNGTSCATPYVAGVAALVKSQNPAWTPAQVRNQLVNNAIDVVNVESGSGWDRYSGYGMVDAEAAVGGGTPAPPTAAFTGSPTSGDAPLSVNFTDQSTGAPTSWSWTFGDGGTSGAQNPSHTYTAVGNYTVTLSVSNAYGSDGETKTNYITVTEPPPPTAAFTGSPTSGTYPLNVTFADQSTGAPTSWSWTFGDGGTSTAQNPSHTYTAAGNYTVSLTATNAYGSDINTKVGYITVTEPGVTTFVTAASETPVAGTVSGSYLNTQVSDNSRETITEVIYVQNAKKRYSYLEHRWSFTLPAGGAVTFHLEASRTNNSEGDNFAFEYSTDGGVLWNPLVTVASATETAYTAVLGTFSGAVTVRATDTAHSFGGEVLDVLAIDYMAFEVGDAQPQPPVAAFTGSPTSGVYPLNVTFTDQSTGAPTSWSWTFGDGGTATVQNPSHTYTVAGTYTVSLTATNAYGSDSETKVNYITVTEPGLTTFVTAAGETPVAGTVSGSYLNTQASDDSRETITEVIYVQNAKKRYSYLEHRWNFTLPVGSAVTFHLEASRTNNSEGDNFLFAYSTDGVLWNPLVTVASATETAYTASLGNVNGTVTVRVTDAAHAFGGEVLDVVSVDYMAFEVVGAAATAKDAGIAVVDGAPESAVFSLSQNYPNPFNPMTTISFTLPDRVHVKLEVFSVTGQRVAVLVDEVREAGPFSEVFDAVHMSSGIYFYRLKAGSNTEIRKMVLVK